MIDGKHLKQLREEHGLTIDELAAAVHVSPSTVSRWENKSALSDYDSIKRIADTYGISVTEITREDSELAVAEENGKEALSVGNIQPIGKKPLSLFKIGLITAASTLLFFAILAALIVVCVYFQPASYNGEVHFWIITTEEIIVLISIIFLITIAVTATVVLICYLIRRKRNKIK